MYDCSIPTHTQRQSCYRLHYLYYHHYYYLKGLGRNIKILVYSSWHSSRLHNVYLMLTTKIKTILSFFYVPQTSLRTFCVVTFHSHSHLGRHVLFPFYRCEDWLHIPESE